MKNNLVPKAIVDRRGVTTTRWVRPDASVDSRPGIPCPEVKTVSVRAILADLKPQEGSVDAPYWTEQRKWIKSHLETFPDPAYLTAVSALVKILHTSQQGGVGVSHRRLLLWHIEEGNRSVIQSLYAHREGFEADIHITTAYEMVIDTLVNKLTVEREQDGRIPTLDAHLKAQQHYERFRMQRSAYSLVPQYSKNREYVAMVERHADHIDALLRYRADRGLESSGKGPAALDEDDFAEYLSHGPIAEGLL